MQETEKLRIVFMRCMVSIQVSTWLLTLEQASFPQVALQSSPHLFAKELPVLSV